MVFVDCETTGLGREDVLCSVGVVSNDICLYELYNEGKKIPAVASSVHNITNEMIQNKPPFAKGEIFSFLRQNSQKTLTGHNLPFDMAMLERSGLFWQGDMIDTLRVSKHLMPDLESYKLNFLRYELRLYKKESRKLIAHNALDDALLEKLLYEELLQLASKEEMIELSQKPVLLQKLPFGKYAGRYIEEVSMIDRGYLEWMLRGINDLDEDLRYSVEYYL